MEGLEEPVGAEGERNDGAGRNYGKGGAIEMKIAKDGVSGQEDDYAQRRQKE